MKRPTGIRPRPRWWVLKYLLCLLLDHRMGKHSSWDHEDGFTYRLQFKRCWRCGHYLIEKRERSA